MTAVELRTTAMAVGGEAVAREPSGRVVFVSGALPDETSVVEVLEASPHRVAPPCPAVAAGCGGCDWQHVRPEAQSRLRREVVAEVLARQAGGADPVVAPGPPLPPEGLRTTVRGVADAAGRFAFRRRRSHETVAVDRCLVAHPLVDEVLAGSRFAPGSTVTVRVGARTGDRLVVVTPTAKGASVPAGVHLVGADELEAGHRAWITEEVAGRRWRVSAGSFFQASPEGAEALVDVAGGLIAELRPDAARLVDLCCGVGLFAGALGGGREVVGVERSASAVADARANLADLDARIIKVTLGRWRPSPADVVVADPARSGLAAEGVAAVAATGAELCVLVSCDPASLGRDAALLAERGYEHASSTVVDLFGHAGHIEVVSGFINRA